MATLISGQWLTQYVAPHNFWRNSETIRMTFLLSSRGAPKAAITADGIRFNKLINNVGFLVNNTAGFTPPTKMTGEKVFIEWEKYDTTPTEVDDAELRALPYDKRSEVRKKHTEAFKIGIRDHVIWKLAPDDDTNVDMPVMRTSGADDGTGRKRLTFKDMVKYLEMVKALNLPYPEKQYMTLSPEHVTDLIVDADSAKFFSTKKIFFDEETGKVRSIMGFKFYENAAVPAYTSAGVKKPKGAALTTGDQRASVFFYAPNAVYHLDKVKILYVDEHTDTRNPDPKSEFRTQTYGIVDRIVDYGFGAIISANV